MGNKKRNDGNWQRILFFIKKMEKKIAMEASLLHVLFLNNSDIEPTIHLLLLIVHLVHGHQPSITTKNF